MAAEYVLKMLPKGTHEWEKFIPPSELASHCRESGLSLKSTRGLTYNPLTQRYSLCADTSVNYLFATQLEALMVAFFVRTRPVRAVLFDLDGTLFDSAPDLGAAGGSNAVSRGLAPLSAEHYRPMVGAGARGSMLN